MKRDAFHNRKWVAWLLAFALLIAVLPANASWQCLDGSPCPPNCPLLAQNSARAMPQPVSSKHCANCPEPNAVVAVSKTDAVCPGASCVFREQATPDVLLAKSFSLDDFTQATLPKTIEIAALALQSTKAISYTPPSLSLARRLLTRCLGRAPPFLLQ